MLSNSDSVLSIYLFFAHMHKYNFFLMPRCFVLGNGEGECCIEIAGQRVFCCVHALVPFILSVLCCVKIKIKK